LSEQGKGVLECPFLKSSAKAKEHERKKPSRVTVAAYTCFSEDGVTNLVLQITDKYSQSDAGIR